MINVFHYCCLFRIVNNFLFDFCWCKLDQFFFQFILYDLLGFECLLFAREFSSMPFLDQVHVEFFTSILQNTNKELNLTVVTLIIDKMIYVVFIHLELAFLYIDFQLFIIDSFINKLSFYITFHQQYSLLYFIIFLDT